MNRCTECEGTVVAGLQTHKREFSKRQFVGQVEGWSCSKCGEVYFFAAGLEEVERLIASWFAHKGVASHDELKFMRKAAGIKAVDLAALLGVTPETVSHWETGKHPADVATKATIAALVLDALKGENETRGLLKAQVEPDTARTVRLGPVAA